MLTAVAVTGRKRKRLQTDSEDGSIVAGKRVLWTYPYASPKFRFFSGSVLDLQFTQYTRFTSLQFNALVDLVGGQIHSNPNTFRENISGAERVFLALSVLSGSSRLHFAGSSNNRSTSTMFKSLKLFVEAALQIMVPLYIVFPTGAAA